MKVRLTSDEKLQIKSEASLEIFIVGNIIQNLWKQVH